MRKKFFLITTRPGSNALSACEAASRQYPQLCELVRIKLMHQRAADHVGWWVATIAALPLNKDGFTNRIEFSDDDPRALEGLAGGILVVDAESSERLTQLIEKQGGIVIGCVDAGPSILP